MTQPFGFVLKKDIGQLELESVFGPFVKIWHNQHKQALCTSPCEQYPTDGTTGPPAILYPTLSPESGHIVPYARRRSLL